MEPALLYRVFSNTWSLKITTDFEMTKNLEINLRRCSPAE